ncbi:hypothetical protein NicSoilB8_14560 [Arthrobacter sp. NicSoilB8]|nr:hypothetical protein NicSoilB8_14560 [Arthrobacter sp. NicSoilB8]
MDFDGIEGGVGVSAGSSAGIIADGSGDGITGGLGWVAHGNHSRVPRRERLYWCESVTFGG